MFYSPINKKEILRKKLINLFKVDFKFEDSGTRITYYD